MKARGEASERRKKGGNRGGRQGGRRGGRQVRRQARRQAKKQAKREAGAEAGEGAVICGFQSRGDCYRRSLYIFKRAEEPAIDGACISSSEQKSNLTPKHVTNVRCRFFPSHKRGERTLDWALKYKCDMRGCDAAWERIGEGCMGE